MAFAASLPLREQAIAQYFPLLQSSVFPTMNVLAAVVPKGWLRRTIHRRYPYGQAYNRDTFSRGDRWRLRERPEDGLLSRKPSVGRRSSRVVKPCHGRYGSRRIQFHEPTEAEYGNGRIARGETIKTDSHCGGSRRRNLGHLYRPHSSKCHGGSKDAGRANVPPGLFGPPLTDDNRRCGEPWLIA